MEHLYSIMPLDLDHVEELCADIKQQYEQGVATCVLFYCKLVPEGKPLPFFPLGIFSMSFVLRSSASMAKFSFLTCSNPCSSRKLLIGFCNKDFFIEASCENKKFGIL